MFAWTVIATTGTRFSDFAPYVASVNAAGTVAFQAALQGGGTGVFIGSGGAVSEVAGPTLLAGITSHPDLNDAGPRASTGTCGRRRGRLPAPRRAPAHDRGHP
jgi:hypothetical protein